ncbi:MAG: hypothetical protein ACM3ML_15945 [Micromonosporaceae bacterium]
MKHSAAATKATLAAGVAGATAVIGLGVAFSGATAASSHSTPAVVKSVSLTSGLTGDSAAMSSTRDDRGVHAESRDDHSRHARPGDDHGRHAEPRDDHGRHAELRDDHGRHGGKDR